ncbi:MAG: sulfurtransferase TusA family protein [Calditrichaceae bacterium]|nr:sulfurtransferase TusA family protein [Calditrichaceae bacterium]MBN2710502.1 sulfurtransferase TusA family protein [Calditrichaceae bacterium]RQV97294.1 MAG: preprotein translocase subunit TatB [Calditrichota bacterium]
MSVTIDARGLSCPQPVLLTLNEIRNGNDPQILVLVDTDTSKENVIRAAASQGCEVNVEPSVSGEYRIAIQKDK